jgi:hypothetical protein
MHRNAADAPITSGDVLVSRPTARADVYEISVVPEVGRVSYAGYEIGMEAGRRLAQTLAVDAWYTCDHTHMHSLGRYRIVAKGAVMGDKGGKKDKEKHQKQQEKKTQGREQRLVDKGRPSVVAPSGRQTQAASMKA